MEILSKFCIFNQFSGMKLQTSVRVPKATNWEFIPHSKYFYFVIIAFVVSAAPLEILDAYC